MKEKNKRDNDYLYISLKSDVKYSIIIINRVLENKDGNGGKTNESENF